jgi:uncharacterized protein (DUF1330 family)
MSAFLVVDITIHDPDMYKEYVSKAPPFIEKYEGVYRVRGGEVATQEGTWSPQRLVVVEFPTREKAMAFLADPGYQAVAAIRHQAATTNMVVADGWPAD